MKKISLLLLPVTLLISATSLAETYEGHGDKTEFGTQTCGMIVTETGGTSFVIEMHALNQEVIAIVSDGAESNFDVQMNSDSKQLADGKKATDTLKIKASGQLKNGKPVSYNLEVRYNYAELGKVVETIHCKF
ncbi:hypothetical protein D3C87_1497350 [compost metagenome]